MLPTIILLTAGLAMTMVIILMAFLLLGRAGAVMSSPLAAPPVVPTQPLPPTPPLAPEREGRAPMIVHPVSGLV